MKKLTDLEYLKLNKFRKILHNLLSFFAAIPFRIWEGIKAIGQFFKKIGLGFVDALKNIGTTFVRGDWKTKVSFFIFGFGSVLRGQILRGLAFFFLEVAYILFMITTGVPNLSMLGTLGTVETTKVMETVYVAGVPTQVEKTIWGDNSFRILLYGVMAIFFTIALIYTWYLNIKQNKISEEILAKGKPLKSNKQDLHSLIDDQFHKSLLALPIVGITLFTVLPTFFMILIAFTNYTKEHMPPDKLFSWVGFQNFGQIFNWNAGSTAFSASFGEILLWTLIWAFFATFTNYFLGMLVALAINKKGIKGKKIFRGILVLTIAIPQFISLLFISKMFAKNGIVNETLLSWGWISSPLPFFEDQTWARITVIIINIWVGIPYLMLMISGVLMNIPSDLYESAKIDGANSIQQYFKITLPYTLFVTGPYLLTSFTGNMNNFNVIYLLTGGGPTSSDIARATIKAGETDLLITWLFKLTVDENNYAMASVIGILVFLVVAVVSLVVYNIIPSVKNEEDFQ